MPNNPINYEKPILIDLSSNRAYGSECGVGSSPTTCSGGTSATETCASTGNTATIVCLSNGGSATSVCSANGSNK